MPNRWILYVKQWAAKKGMSYGCALSQPQLKTDYRKAYPTKQQEKFKESVERGEMGDEDKDASETLEDMLKTKLNNLEKLINSAIKNPESSKITKIREDLESLYNNYTSNKKRLNKTFRDDYRVNFNNVSTKFTDVFD
jgi:molybdopterin converting factor small subunit